MGVSLSEVRSTACDWGCRKWPTLQRQLVRAKKLPDGMTPGVERERMKADGNQGTGTEEAES
jgi:hypothetical protein